MFLSGNSLVRWIWRWPMVNRSETVRNLRGNNRIRAGRISFLNRGGGKFSDAADAVGGGFNSPEVGRGLALREDFDSDGDPGHIKDHQQRTAYNLYRNDHTAKSQRHSISFEGTKSNRDAIGEVVLCSTRGKSNERGHRKVQKAISSIGIAVTFGLAAPKNRSLRGDRLAQRPTQNTKI